MKHTYLAVLTKFWQSLQLSLPHQISKNKKTKKSEEKKKKKIKKKAKPKEINHQSHLSNSVVIKYYTNTSISFTNHL